MTENPSIPASVEKLSIVDKYFSLKKEQRINRMQFFVRNLVILTLWLLTILLVTGFYALQILSLEHNQWIIIGFMFSLLGSPLLIGPFGYIVCINICKRAHDYNHTGILFFIACVVISLFLIVISGTLMLKGEEIGFIGSISGVILTPLALLLLQLRKGNPGSNKYGPAPTGKPLV